MRTRKIIWFVVFNVCILNCIFAAVFAQGPAQETKKGPFKITVVGKINHMKELGGYYLQGEKPRGEFMIVNQDPKVLKEIMKSKKSITVEGSLKGAEFLTIEKIDGKKYTQ